MSSGHHRKDIAINGRFLTQKLSGVQRYSRELVQAMDRLIQSEPDRFGARRWRLLVPAGADSAYALTAITIETVGRSGGHLWEQRDLARAAAGSRLLNLGNSGPLLHRDRLVIIHDAAVFRTPANFGRRYRLAHQAMSWALARTGRIGTVSEFSRGELAQVLPVRRDDVLVVRNGSDHLSKHARDEAVLGRLGLEPGRYFLFVGNPAPNKNLAALIKAFAQADCPGAKLALAGSLDRSVFGGGGEMLEVPGLVIARGCTDAQIGALYAHAVAHVFPSLYEGFGIPPLEAMANQCPVIASDIPVVREVCGAMAHYFDPHDPGDLARAMREHWLAPRRSRAYAAAAAEHIAHFTWDASARTLIEAALATDMRCETAFRAGSARVSAAERNHVKLF